MKFKTLCAMFDCSRNAVMTVEAVKKMIALVAKMGYNAAMLYTEDTFEIEGYPFFGYLRGRYTGDELREIDCYAASLGVEMIPCIQALGHLQTTLRWEHLPRDTKDILLTDDERTYEFIDRAFATMSECFASRRIHIGFDEAADLGLGEHLKRHGYEPTMPLIRRHLARVNEIAKKYGYTPLIWSDMFFLSWNDGNYWLNEKKTVPDDVIASVPDGVRPVYWDYYSLDSRRYDAMLYNHRQISDEPWFAGGIWSWRGVIPHNLFSVNSMTAALDACEANGIENVIMALWGDDGANCSHFSQLTALYHIAKYAHGVRDTEEIKRGFEEEFGIPYDEYNAIDLPNQPGSPELGTHTKNPSKYMFYSDYFNGHNDFSVCEEDAGNYKLYAERLRGVASRIPDYGYVFETAAALSEVLYYKYALGVRTRRAYRSGDKDELRRLAIEDYTRLEELIPIYHEALARQWYKENKPTGFDVQELRIGGVLLRTTTCKRRILDYTAGLIESIPELEEEILPRGKVGESVVQKGEGMITVHVYQMV